MWLLADLGGTHTRVGLATQEGLIAGSMQRFANQDHISFEALLRHYISLHKGERITALCAGVAGPVREESAQLTNHAWQVRKDALAASTGASQVILINDLQAQAYALDDLDQARVTPLFKAATAAQGATRMVLGLGTGCNIAVAHHIGDSLFVPPSESGHMSLPQCTGPMSAMITEVGAGSTHLPIEQLLSGAGMLTIWSWLGGEETTPKAIVESDTARARETCQLFAELFGKVTGDMALAHLPMGGIFLIGGVARAIAPHLAGSTFLEAFAAKGQYAHILRTIPISLIEDDMAGLRGCLRCLKQSLA